MSMKELQRSGTLPPAPPSNGYRDRDDGEPDPRSEMKEFVLSSRETQVRSYRDWIHDWLSNERRREYLREMAKEFAEREASISEEEFFQAYVGVDIDIIKEADAWFEKPQTFDLPKAIVQVFGQLEEAWELADLLGLNDDDARGFRDLW